MTNVIGNNSDNKLSGTNRADQISGEGGNDYLSGKGGNDLIRGGSGDDEISGGNGNDVVYGSSGLGGAVDMNDFTIGADVTAKVTFQTESAGYRNTLGTYKIANDGTIYDVQILFANASLKGSGGDLKAGKSSVKLDLEAGDNIGFFVVANAYAQRGMANALDEKKGSFEFRDADGNPGHVNNGEMSLWHISAKGHETLITSQYGSSVFHSNSGTKNNLNGDGVNHVQGNVDTGSGVVTIGFEDLWNGGDQDFDDSVFTVDIGSTNSVLLPLASSKSKGPSDDDVITGGNGNDELFGMSGADIISGGNGKDVIWGNSGDDELHGDKGNDQVNGGKGNDVITGDAGNDVLRGNSGDDSIDGGSGNDEIMGGKGNDELEGGAGNDLIDGCSGDDTIDGGAGNDVLEGESGNDYIEGGSGNDSITAGSGDDVLSDGSGNDEVDGGSGDDHFIAGLGNDRYDGGSGHDSISFAGASSGVSINLHSHKATGLGNDTIWSIEEVTGSSHHDSFKGDKRDNVFDGGDGNDSFRGLGGSDIFTGGAGADSFVWLTKDVISSKTGDHLGVDAITDFGADDVLNFHSMVKNFDYDAAGDVVQLTDTAAGTMVSILAGDAFVDVVMLDDVHDVGVDYLIGEGMLVL